MFAINEFCVMSFIRGSLVPGEKGNSECNIGTETFSHPIFVSGAGSTRVRQGPTNAASTIGGLSLIEQGVLHTIHQMNGAPLCPVPNNDTP